MESRFCNKCNQTLTLDNFSINAKGKFGRKSVCKPCCNKDQKSLATQRKGENPDLWRKYRYEKHLKSAYGLTPEAYLELLDKQDHKCAICGREENLVGNKLFVDHCHESGAVRGILCYHCNTLLGMSFDNVETLICAVTYLKKFDRVQGKSD